MLRLPVLRKVHPIAAAVAIAACGGTAECGGGIHDTFFAVHCDPFTGYNGEQATWDKWFDLLTEFVTLADSYGYKLTIQFSPQCAGGFLADMGGEPGKNWTRFSNGGGAATK